MKLIRSWAAASSALMIVASFICAEPAGAASVAVGISQHNIAGNSLNNGNTWADDALVFAVGGENPKPWLITANEVCDPQASRLNTTFTASTYNYRHPVRPTTKYVSTSCGYYGSDYYLLGSLTSHGQTWTLTGGSEPRKLACQEAQSLLGPFGGCVLHTAPDAAAAQTKEAYSDIANAWSGVSYPALSSQTRLVGGDFNTGYWGDTVDWFNNYWEMDGSLLRKTFSVTSLTSKIDYGFGDKAHFTSTISGPGPACNIDSSKWDHCEFHGYIYLP